VPVTLIIRNKEYQVEPGLTIQEAIRQIGLEPETYLAVRDGQLADQDEVLRDGEVIKLVAVISGGNLAY
jgi:sulfur carrier protein ThiS